MSALKLLGHPKGCILHFIEFILHYIFVTVFFRLMSGAGSSGTGRGRGTASLTDNKTENKDTKPNPKMSKALSTSAKRYSCWTSQVLSASVFRVDTHFSIHFHQFFHVNYLVKVNNFC
jgi:hypothetical protein